LLNSCEDDTFLELFVEKRGIGILKTVQYNLDRTPPKTCQNLLKINLKIDDYSEKNSIKFPQQQQLLYIKDSRVWDMKEFNIE